MTEHRRVAIVGAGFSGLGMAIGLQHAGIHDFVVLERADDVGGTWRDNSYPGCACDVPSHLYSFSFAPNPSWTRSFSRQPEILAYLRDVAERSGLLRNVRFGHELLAATWEDDEQRWSVETSRGPLTADFLVSATGPLSEPMIPDLPGLETFSGRTFHSATWDHDFDLTGKRVAVVGTGASAVQFVPQIQPKVASLHVFQRTAPWVMPRPDRPITAAERAVHRALPVTARLRRAGIYWGREAVVLAMRHPRLMRTLGERVARRHLEQQVPDPALRAKLVPDYRMGCKRILLSDDYLPSLLQANVEVVTSGVREVRSGGVVAADGTERDVDAIIFGTGFHVTDVPIAARVRGRGGRLLADEWGGSPTAHLGTTVSGYPNLFLLLGPNHGTGHTSVVFMAEQQTRHVVRALRAMRETGATTIEPRPDVQRAFVTEMDRASVGTVWTAGGCASWYLDRTGRNSTLWPGFTWSFKRRLERFDPDEYVLARRGAVLTTTSEVRA